MLSVVKQFEQNMYCASIAIAAGLSVNPFSMQLWNPSGSNRNFHVKHIEFYLGGGGDVAIGFVDSYTAAATAGTVEPFDPRDSAISYSFSGEERVTPTWFKQLREITYGSNGWWQLPYTNEIIVPPSYGLQISHSNSSAAWDLIMELEERAR